jgi:hypothetical protein
MNSLVKLRVKRLAKTSPTLAKNARMCPQILSSATRLGHPPALLNPLLAAPPVSVGRTFSYARNFYPRSQPTPRAFLARALAAFGMGRSMMLFTYF